MNNPLVHGLQVWPASVNPSDCELCLSNPLIHLFRRRLYLLPRYGQGIHLAFTFVCCMALLAICWAKGEPTEWRWGKK